MYECHGSSEMTLINGTSIAVGVACKRTLTAQWPWVPGIGQNLQPFTGNGDVSIWVKNSRVGRETPNKQFKTNRNSLGLIWPLIFIFVLCHVSFNWSSLLFSHALKLCFMQTNTPGSPFFSKHRHIWLVIVHIGSCLLTCFKLSCDIYK